MLTERHYPLFLTHDELDDYLAKGWYRMNQMIFTCHFIYFNEGIFSPVWIRLDLQQARFSKSLRKLIARNKRRFRIHSKVALINSEKEMLYKTYREHFDGHLAESLQDALMDSTNINIYDTQEICIYDGDQLVAVSFFDKGNKSVASILGIYDPAYAKYSLGFFTMLMEIEWSVKNGKQYYYPGYIIPGRPRFDYKLRIGDVEYYDPKDQSWKDFKAFDSATLPICILRRRLDDIQQALVRHRLPVKKVFYPLFEEELIEFRGKTFMKYPLFLSCGHRNDNLFPLTLEYDLIKASFRLSRFVAVENLLSVYTDEMAGRYQSDLCCLSFLYREDLILESNDPAKIALHIRQSLR